MAFRPYTRRPVAFGYALFYDPQQQPTAQYTQHDLRETWMVPFQTDVVPVKTERFLLGKSRPRTASPADIYHDEQSTHFALPTLPLSELPDRCGSGTEMGTSSTSLTVGAASFPAGNSTCSASTVVDTSECSSMAPYWVPEEIKHYFRHRHSATQDAEEALSSQKTDSALRDIGNERELPAIDSGIWSRWSGKWCRSHRCAMLTVTAVAVGSLLAMLFIMVAAGFHLYWPNSGLHAGGAPRGEDAAGAEESLGDYLIPAPKQDYETREGAKRNEDYGGLEEIAANSRTGDQGEETGNGGGEALPERDNTDMTGGLRVNSAIVFRKATRLICGQPVFRFCSGGPPEFYYNGTSNACVLLASHAPGVCNRGRNRFASMDNCNQQCVYIQTPAPECYQKAVFAECQARDIIDTWWWYMDGKGCRRWRFPDGRCPSNGTDAFRTSLDCVRRCANPKTRKPCRAPTAALCEAKQLRFGFFADADPRGSGARRCRELPSAGGERARHCLAGANRFPTMEACRKACVRAVA